MYLLALVCHQEIFDRGIASIYHFQLEAYYKALLHATDDKFLDLIVVVAEGQGVDHISLTSLILLLILMTWY